jgi:hypothetical protein
VLNGRDIGTVVFPEADIKFFLTASPEERAERRFEEDRLTHADVSLEQTMTEMVERDRRDSTRADSPLKVADGAIVIDSSGLSIDEVFERMMSMFTGIIEELGSVRSIEERGENARIVINATVVTEGTNHGDSIAVNGVCLTALDIHHDSFAADVSRETLLRSTLGR